MKVGIPKEIKNNENRIAITPAGVDAFVKAGHQVYIQSSAGVGSGFSDDDFKNSGAVILTSMQDVYAIADMIFKVKEPIAPEYSLIREGQIIFTYFHFASSEELTLAMIASKAICIAYETVEAEDRTLPLLVPMSEVAGRMSVQQGAKYLEKPYGGKGILLGGVPGTRPGNVVILGGGVVGTQAAKMAAGLGASVTIMDISLQRLRHLADIMPANVNTLVSNSYNIDAAIRSADLIIGAVLIPGAKAPKIISRDMLTHMKKGTVLVDVAVDQGGCFETTKPTTHQDPIFIIDDIVHYCVANMPGALSYTSTLALTNATLPYALQIANKGWEKACADNLELKKGLNILDGNVVHEGTATAWNLPLVDYSELCEVV